MTAAAAESDLSARFPLCTEYTSLPASGPRAVRERARARPSFEYTERHLQCVWADAAWRPIDLRDADGEAVTVIEPGRWNLEPGPDFLDAVLGVGPARRLLRGDVEVHVHPEDWLRHGHAADPAYGRVAAHVTYFAGTRRPAGLPPAAVRLPLREALAANPAFSFDSVDPTAYPYAVAPASRPAPCQRALRTLPARTGEDLLEAAGHERLRRKAARLAAAVRELGPDQAFYEAFMVALGYKHNTPAFRRLARALPATELADAGASAEDAYALLMGVAGLLPAAPSPRWDAETRAFVRRLWDLWWPRQSTLAGRVLPSDCWRLTGLRPVNRPPRRLAAAAALMTARPPLLARLRELPSDPPRAWLRAASGLLQETPGLPYWRRRLSFASRAADSDIALIGDRRAAAILVNVVIPLLAALGRPVEALLDALPAEGDNSLIRQTAYSLFGADHNPAFYRRGLRQQGLLQIFHDFCLQTRRGCRDCPLAGALRRRKALPH